MKKALWILLLFIPLFSIGQISPQTNDLTKTWLEVDRLFSIKNYEQALPLLGRIKAESLKRKDDALWLRAFLAETQVAAVNTTDDNQFEKIDQLFQNNISTAKPLVKDVLYNFYASFLENNLHRYLSNSSNKFVAAEHQQKWDMIDSLYKLSLTNKDRLKTEKSENWSSMFSDLTNVQLTPTLFHYLSINYLSFLKKDMVSYKNAYQNLHQEIMALNKNKDYKISATFFASQNSALKTNNNLLYFQSLREIMKTYPSDYNAYLLYLIAHKQYYMGNKKEALALVEEAEKNYPNSPWLNNAKNLNEDIKRVEIGMDMKQFQLQNSYSPISLRLRNVDQLYIRVYRTTNHPNELKKFTVKYDSTTFVNSLDAPLAYEEVFPIKDLAVGESKRTIYKINPLPYGHYTILISNNAEFKDDDKFQKVSINNFYITDFFFSATLEKENENNEEYHTLFINRRTGQPYANKTFSLYEFYDKNPLKIIQKIKTDQRGFYHFKTNEKKDITDINDYYIYLADENQFIDLSEFKETAHHVRYDQEKEEIEGEVRINAMLDRGIYRPGQPLYFKAIIYNDHYLKGRVLADQKIKVYLHDVNFRKVDSLELTSNAYGSIHGEFILPNPILAGRFRLSFQQKDLQLGEISFRVEEYKRPTFEVKLETNKETYRKKDTAVFQGQAMSLNGAPLVGASVHYKVNYSARGQQYKNGLFVDSTTTTNELGKFTIKVPLMDSTFHTFTDFRLNYEVEVVNQNGEMQSAASSYQYSDKPWRIQIQTPRNVEEYRWSSIQVHTLNNNNQPLKFAGDVQILKVKDPTVVVPEHMRSYFRDVDFHLFSNSEYKKYFPTLFDDVFIGDQKSELIKSYSFDTRDTTLVKIDSNLFGRGRYFIKALSIQGQDSIRAQAMVSVFDKATGKSLHSEFLTYTLDKPSYKEGDEVTLNLFTDLKEAKSLYLFSQIGNKKLPLQVLSWNNGRIVYKFKLTEEQLNNNMLFQAMLIFDNKLSSLPINIPIERENRTVEIKTQTFRDKITPGQKEKWSFTITKKEEKMQAEVLASMYDASLDVFQGNYFSSSFSKQYPYFQSYYNNHMYGNFYASSDSYSLFRNFKVRNTKGTEFPSIKNYGLWITPYWGENKVYDFAYSDGVHGSSRRQVIEEVVTVTAAGKVAGVNVSPSLMLRGTSSPSANDPLYVIDGEIVSQEEFNSFNKDEIAEFKVLKDAEATALYGSKGANGVLIVTSKLGKQANEQLSDVKTRTNLQETAFFFPTLYTDSEGNVSFEFDSPEALTKWKLQLFAHDKELNAGSATFYTQTQKQLMVRPNLPRYFREGDEIVIKTQIQNLSKKALSGTAKIEVINPENNEVITNKFIGEKAITRFETQENTHGLIEWTLKIPAGYPTVQIKVIAGTNEFSDGELSEIPILTNKVLITDSEKIMLKPDQEKEYLIKIAAKENVQTKVQIQSNPILEIISALDYLKNYPYECTEQLTSKWFALQVLQYVDKSYPAISDYFRKLNTEDKQSKMESNAELNSFKLEEMPWLKTIENDGKKLQELAKLFRSNFTSELKAIEQKIVKNQTREGGFPWFDGGKVDPYISIRILEIMGKTLTLDKSLISKEMKGILPKLTSYLDTTSAVFGPKASESTALDYLYARRYWSAEFPISEAIKAKLKSKVAIAPLLTANRPAGVAAKAWIVNQLFGTGKESTEIRNRLQQEVILDELKGMYWESNEKYYNGISMQAYVLEAYKMYDPSKLMPISQWFFYKKETNYWYSTWMTVDAIYAILLANNPKDFSLENTVVVRMNGNELAMDDKVLGQASKVIPKEELNQDTRFSVKNNNVRNIFGGIYHQYFVPVEDVKSSTNEIKVSKEYLVEREGKWVPSNQAVLGEKIKVRITVINDKPLQYVHLKDSRPSGVEPVYQLSGYRYWERFYFTMKDASTNYFFDSLGKGKFTYEYEVKANNLGRFNSGITTLECMYDPTVNARSENVEMSIVK